jgi:hypothetical protein
MRLWSQLDQTTGSRMTPSVGGARALSLKAATTLGMPIPQVGDASDDYIPTITSALPMSHPQMLSRHDVKSGEPPKALPTQVHSGLVGPTIIVLLALSRPTAVPWLVVPIIVDPVKTQAAPRAGSHVFQEGGKTVAPTVTHGDTSTTVGSIALALGVETAVPGAPPSLVLDLILHRHTGSVPRFGEDSKKW